MWLFESSDQPNEPSINDQATQLGALNENRFGWGATAADFDNDGNIDLAQANGMVDDSFDKKHEVCPDYWYVNEKIARSPPSVHRYIDAWGDIRGMCIHGKESNRLYLNRADQSPRFVDVAQIAGLNQKGNWRGVASADLNNDGRVDLVISSIFANPLVFKNQVKTKSKNWIGLELVSESQECHRSAQGSKVVITYIDGKGRQQKRTIEKTIVNGFSAQSDPRLHLGLGKGVLKQVDVHWCNSKQKSSYTALDMNKYHKLTFNP